MKGLTVGRALALLLLIAVVATWAWFSFAVGQPPYTVRMGLPNPLASLTPGPHESGR
jgi:hypothetical protein